MSSDAPAGVAHLAELLARAGDGPAPTPVELAELLWLSQHLPGPAPATNSAALRSFGGAGNCASNPHRPAAE
ncbi:hypothetical protein, partial [Streptomyces apricus]|uniref:hypothetical protein n=1 Tax=Streptomyces apricus TaxID=1828112 RepID=UPI00165F1D99